MREVEVGAYLLGGFFILSTAGGDCSDRELVLLFLLWPAKLIWSVASSAFKKLVTKETK